MRPGQGRLGTLVAIAGFASLAVGSGQAMCGEIGAASRVLRLVLFDPCGTAPGLHEGTLLEVRKLLAPTGLGVEHLVAEPGHTDAPGSVYIVLLPRDPSRPRGYSPAGGCRREAGRQPTVWTFPPVVAGGLGFEHGRLACWTDRQRREFQRALALVVVHELAHLLAGALHRKDGLMAPQLDRQLRDPMVAVDPDLGPAFLAGAARLDAGRRFGASQRQASGSAPSARPP